MGAVASIFFITKSGIGGIAGILLSLLIGAAAGAVWGAIPGILKITRGLNEMIVSIMLNYVATLFMGYVIPPFYVTEVYPRPLQSPTAPNWQLYQKAFPSTGEYGLLYFWHLQGITFLFYTLRDLN